MRLGWRWVGVLVGAYSHKDTQRNHYQHLSSTLNETLLHSPTTHTYIPYTVHKASLSVRAEFDLGGAVKV